MEEDYEDKCFKSSDEETRRIDLTPKKRRFKSLNIKKAAAVAAGVALLVGAALA